MHGYCEQTSAYNSYFCLPVYVSGRRVAGRSRYKRLHNIQSQIISTN